MEYRKSANEKLVDSVNYLLILLFSISVLYPFYFIFINSVNADLAFGRAFLAPETWTRTYYDFIFRDHYLFRSFFITVARTVIGVAFSLLVMSMCAYALRKKGVAFRGFYLTLFTITLFFDGGLIPKYLTYQLLGMLDHFIVYILPDAFRFFLVIIFMSGFNNVPDAIEESAKIDGANDFTIYFKFYLYLALPVVATMALFDAVHHWNSWMDSIYFTSSRELQTLPAVLIKLIKEGNTQDFLSDMQESENIINPDGIKYATMILTLLPITMVYPFLQRFFIKGITVGSIKG